MYVIQTNLREFYVDDIGAAKYLIGFFLRHGMKEVSVYVKEDDAQK